MKKIEMQNKMWGFVESLLKSSTQSGAIETFKVTDKNESIPKSFVVEYHSPDSKNAENIDQEIQSFGFMIDEKRRGMIKYTFEDNWIRQPKTVEVETPLLY